MSSENPPHSKPHSQESPEKGESKPKQEVSNASKEPPCTPEKLFLESQLWGSSEMTWVSRTQCKSTTGSGAGKDAMTGGKSPGEEEPKQG